MVGSEASGHDMKSEQQRILTNHFTSVSPWALVIRLDPSQNLTTPSALSLLQNNHLFLVVKDLMPDDFGRPVGVKRLVKAFDDDRALNVVEDVSPVGAGPLFDLFWRKRFFQQFSVHYVFSFPAFGLAQNAKRASRSQ
jgi:hypothetical protein